MGLWAPLRMLFSIVQVIMRKLTFPHIIAATHIPELLAITKQPDGGVVLGAAVTLTQLEEVFSTPLPISILGAPNISMGHRR